MGRDRKAQDRQDQDNEGKSRTRAKLEVEALQRLGEQLINLSLEQIRTMEIPETLKKEVIFAKTITRHGAMRRQLQYIGSIMRTIDPETIVAAIDRLSMARAVASSKFKAMEKIREDLMGGDASAMEAFLESHPQADRQRLRQLVRNASQEIAAKKPPKAYRLLFKYIREIMESRDN
jgi:ribosome-associated protein